MGGRVGKLERGGIGKNGNKREGGLDVKFNTYRGGGALLFHSFLQTGKVLKELLEFKYNFNNIGIKLTNLSTPRCSDL